MFLDSNQKVHADKKFIKIEDIVINWDEDNLLHVNGYDIHKNRTTRLFVNKFKKDHEVRCAICGCKASHFRVDIFYRNPVLNLYGFYKSKDGNTEYRRFNLDHIKPKSLISVNESILLGEDNFQPTCAICNSKKGNDVGLPKEEREYKCKKYKIERAIFDLYIQTNIRKKLKLNIGYDNIRYNVSSYILNNLDNIVDDFLINNKIIYDDSFYHGKIKGKERDYTVRDKIFNMYLDRNACKASGKSSFGHIQKMVKTYIYNHLDEIVSTFS